MTLDEFITTLTRLHTEHPDDHWSCEGDGAIRLRIRSDLRLPHSHCPLTYVAHRLFSTDNIVSSCQWSFAGKLLHLPAACAFSIMLAADYGQPSPERDQAFGYWSPEIRTRLLRALDLSTTD